MPTLVSREIEALDDLQGSGGKSGLHSRLGSLASRQRGGDKFCFYVADKISCGGGLLCTDQFVRDYVCQHVSYRYYDFDGLTADELDAARRLERQIQAGETPLGRPLLNPRQAPKNRRSGYLQVSLRDRQTYLIRIAYTARHCRPRGSGSLSPKVVPIFVNY